MIVEILWRGSFYDFLRIVERLSALVRIYAKTRHIDNQFPDADVREEIIVSMMRSPKGNPTAFCSVVDGMLLNEGDDYFIDDKAVAKIQGQFNYRTTQVVIVRQPGGRLHYIRRELKETVKEAL